MVSDGRPGKHAPVPLNMQIRMSTFSFVVMKPHYDGCDDIIQKYELTQQSISNVEKYASKKHMIFAES